MAHKHDHDQDRQSDQPPILEYETPANSPSLFGRPPHDVLRLSLVAEILVLLGAMVVLDGGHLLRLFAAANCFYWAWIMYLLPRHAGKPNWSCGVYIIVGTLLPAVAVLIS